MTEIPAYDPRRDEEEIYRSWLAQKVFRSVPRAGERPYTIVIPPPNVTGSLHMGHVLNNTIQDVLIRRRRMQGAETLWLPGTDHAGIATQNVVERYLGTQGRKREDLGREAFTAEVWKWREKNGSTIIRQLQRMGCSCDWDRERFTLEPSLSRAVSEVFTRLYHKGLIYRGRYIVNWCPRCTSAISDEEVIHKEIQGSLYYVRYPFADGEGGVSVATTRPETMLGDTAVAVNPKDERYTALVGRRLRLPLTDRVIPIIADEAVDPAFGTGAVKVTPAHDPNDFLMGGRHGLEAPVIMDEKGKMTALAGRFAGMDRFACRKEALKALEEQGLLEKVDKHRHAVGHCQRCDSVVEPYLSLQWFVRMKPLAEPAIAAVESGAVTFHPSRWTGVYLNWMQNIRDWCISRQLWWGHRIPVYTCGACGEVMVTPEAPARCAKCGSAEVVQDPDVLDTWFSSWLWPFSTLGWPEETEDLRYYYPTQTLVTAGDIIFFWVARMIMAGIEFTGRPPFADVYLHGIVKDERGRRMSKSLGNSADPLEVMAEVGADALRMALVYGAAEVEGLRFSDETLEVGRNFVNKLWNAWRFIGMNLEEGEAPALPPPGVRTLEDRWILARLGEVTSSVDGSLESFRIGEGARDLYRFAWHDFCDWYVELAKLRLREGGDGARAARGVLVHVMGAMARLLHPYVPYVTEAIWRGLPACNGTIARAPWPVAEPAEGPEAVRAFETLREVTTAIRTLRAELEIAPGAEARAAIRAESAADREALEGGRAGIMMLARLKELRTLTPGEARPRPSASGIARGVEVYLLLDELVDVGRERTRLGAERERLRALVAGVERKLGDPEFVGRAPAEVVERERDKGRNFQSSLTKVETLLADLGD